MDRAVRDDAIESGLPDADLRALIHRAAHDYRRSEFSPALREARAARADIAALLLRLAAAGSPEAAVLAVDAAAGLQGFREFAAVGEVLEAVIADGRVDALPERVQADVWLWGSRTLAMSADGSQHRGVILARWRRGRAIAERLDDPVLDLHAHMVGSLNTAAAGDLPLASRLAAEGMRVARQRADSRWIARFEAVAAGTALLLGDESSATALALDALARGQRLGEASTIAGAVLILNMRADDAPPDPHPVPSLEDALALVRISGDVVTESTLCAALTSRELRAGRPEEAARQCADRLELCRSNGWAPLVSWSLVHTVVIAEGASDPGFAARIGGAVHAEIDRILRTMDPPTQVLFHLAQEAARACLGAEAFAHTSGAGRMLSIPEAAAEAIDWFAARSRGARSDAVAAGSLTAREREVLALLAEGFTNKEIAIRLAVSTKTVMHHSMSIYRKLGVRGRAEATAHAFRHGLVGRRGS